MFLPATARRITGSNTGSVSQMEHPYIPHQSLLTEQFLQTLQDLKIHGNISPTFLHTNSPTMYHPQNMSPYSFGQTLKGPIFNGNMDQMAVDQFHENPYSV